MGKLLSIITVCYNEESTINETIESVLKYPSLNYEYIIVDGNSTDSTLSSLKRYESIFTERGINFKWISEADNGVYDAMNKGISMCKGHYIYHLNSGDYLIDIPEKVLINNLKNNSVASSFCVSLDNGEKIFKPIYNWKIKITNTLHHQGTFYKRDSMSLYNLEFKIFSDFDLNQNNYKNKKNIKIYTDIVVAKHSTNGISNNRKNFMEVFKVIKKNYGFKFCVISFFYFKWRGFLNRLGGGYV